MLEDDIQNLITSHLTRRGVLWWRCSLGGLRVKGARVRNPMKGFPDLAFILPGGTGRFGVIECKVPKRGRWYPKQVHWRERLEAQGVLYIVGDSIDSVADRLTAYERFGA